MQIAISQTIKNECKDYFYITLGLLLYTFGWTIFLLPYQIVTGGVTGIAAVIYYGTGIPIYLSYFLINAALLLAALKILGFKFMVKTVYAIIMLSLFLALAQDWMIGEDGKMVQILGEGQDFMSLIIGCLFTGLSLAIVFLHNGSTGGTDIVGAIVNKYKNISIGRALLFCDFIIIGSSFFLFHDVEKIVFGFVEMFVSNYIIDVVLNGNRQSVQFLIFSQKYDEIAEHIINDLGRGCTILDGVGGYSRKPVKVVVLLAKKSESVSIFRLVKQIDHQAFISQSIVRGVYGEGFDQIKT